MNLGLQGLGFKSVATETPWGGNGKTTALNLTCVRGTMIFLRIHLMVHNTPMYTSAPQFGGNGTHGVHFIDLMQETPRAGRRVWGSDPRLFCSILEPRHLHAVH